MHQPLVPCPSCSRHVRATEAACPFCEAALPRDLVRRAIPGSTRRLSRAAAFMFGATLAVSACGEGSIVALYGAPGGGGGSGGSGGSGGGDAGPDDGGMMEIDGDPMFLDAGMDATMEEKDGSVEPIYGSPPPPPDEG